MEGGADLQMLMCRLADGDRSAFQPVFEILWPLLRRVASRRLPADLAEDAAQEALIKIFRRASEFDRSRSAAAWAIGIAGYEVRTVLQKIRRRREEAGGLDDEMMMNRKGDAEDDPETIALSRDLENALGAVMGSLRREDSETLRLYAHGLRPALPQATFRKRIERALTRLR